MVLAGAHCMGFDARPLSKHPPTQQQSASQAAQLMQCCAHNWHSQGRMEQAIPESALFTAMQDQERRCDALVKRKRAAVLEAQQRPQHIKKRLRVYVRHEHAHQSQAAQQQQQQQQQQPSAEQQDGDVAMQDAEAEAQRQAAAATRDPPQWVLFVAGRLVDPPGQQQQQQQQPGGAPQQPGLLQQMAAAGPTGAIK